MIWICLRLYDTQMLLYTSFLNAYSSTTHISNKRHSVLRHPLSFRSIESSSLQPTLFLQPLGTYSRLPRTLTPPRPLPPLSLPLPHLLHLLNAQIILLRLDALLALTRQLGLPFALSGLGARDAVLFVGLDFGGARGGVFWCGWVVSELMSGGGDVGERGGGSGKGGLVARQGDRPWSASDRARAGEVVWKEEEETVGRRRNWVEALVERRVRAR